MCFSVLFFVDVVVVVLLLVLVLGNGVALVSLLMFTDCYCFIS